MDRPTPGRDARGRVYALAFINPLRRLRTALADASPNSIATIARGYQHSPGGDLTRIQAHHNCRDDAEATEWLIRAAAAELEAWVSLDGDIVALREGVSADDLRYQGEPLVRDDGAAPNAVLKSPFNPDLTTGWAAKNIRPKERDDLDELRQSMRDVGWLPHHPAIFDVNGRVLVGHRRLAVADELKIPVREGFERFTLDLGHADPGDARRLKIAIYSNLGVRPLNDRARKHIAHKLYGKDWSMAQIAETLKVSTQTISNDLVDFQVVENQKRAKTASNPRGSGRPKGSKSKPLGAAVKRAQEAAAELEARGIKPTRDAVQAATGLGETPVRAGITAHRAVSSAQAALEPAVLRSDVTRPAPDPLRRLIFDFLDTATRPLEPADAAELIARLQRALEP